MKKILDALSGSGEVSVADLSEKFNVSTMTIRRDLEFLERQSLLTRTHGGAIIAPPSVAAFEFQESRKSQMAEKNAIAQAAARLVKPGMTVIIDTGTTTLELAHALRGIKGIKVLTSSLAIASALLAHDGIELVLLGGTVNRNSPDLSGPLTESNISAFRAELAFIGADAADNRGFYTDSQQIAQVSRAMIASAQKVILLLDSSKFEKTNFVRIAGWGNVDMLFVDEHLNAKTVKWLKKTIKNYSLAPIATKEKT